MPTTTFPCNKDARIAQTGSTNLGAGKSDYLPVGKTGSYLYRSLLGFSYDFTGMVSITNATLHAKTSSQHYLGFGSDPDVNIYRIIESWSEGSAVDMTTSNAVHWGNQPSVDATRHVGSTAVAESENTWELFDITNLMQAALAAGVFYGLRLRASDESNEADRTEFYAREYGSNDAYIEVTYTNNTAPKAPTLTAPNAAATTSLTPTFSFTHNDDELDACVKYKIEVMTSPGSGTMMWNSGELTTGISSVRYVNKVYAGSPLANGTAYYWRAVTYDGALWGAWTGWRAFVTYRLPTVGLTEPASSGIVAKVSYTAGSGWATPRLSISWDFNDGDVHVQSHYRVQIGTTPGSGNLYDSGAGMIASAAESIIPTLNLTDGQLIYVRVMVRCSAGVDSAWSPERSIRTHFGMARFFADLGSVPNTWSVSSLITTRTDPTKQSVVVEYNSNTSAAIPGSYYSGLSSATRRQFFHYRVWLMAWGSATPVNPSLDKLVLSYSTNIIVPDHWSIPANGSIDESARVYGTQSLRMDSTGVSTDRAYQYIKLEPDTHYVAQARIKAQGAAGAQLLIATGPTGYAIKGFDTAVDDTGEEWVRRTLEFDSGDLDECYVQCALFGAAGTTAWYDAIKVEASEVATAWSPGFIGEGVVLDAGGVAVDRSMGGTFRLRGGNGGDLDVIDLGMSGLRVGAAQGLELFAAGPGDLWFLNYNSSAIVRAVGDANSISSYSAFAANREGDSTARMTVGYDGGDQKTGLFVGPGNAGRDVNLYRASANRWATDDGLAVGANTWTNIAGVIAIPFSWTGALPATGVTDMPIGDSSVAVAQMRYPWACQVVGISICSTANRSAGTLTAQAFNGSNSTLVGPTAVLDATNLSLHQSSQSADGTTHIAANSLFRLRLTTAGWGPTTTIGIKGILFLATLAN